MIHVFISNIFMLNYLVAILSTVYEIMKDEGEFSFKANKYQFIEKYSVAMLDPNGYSELIIHPPPLNVFTLFILPCIIKKSLMKKAADVFSKLIFWSENILYLMVFLSYELVLCPFIYFKLMIIVLRFSRWKQILQNMIIWMFGGMFILLGYVAKDLFYYIKILCDYQEEEEQFKEREEEDFKQDRIVIFNEVIDVMQSIIHIFKKRKEEAKRKRLLLNSQVSNTIKAMLDEDDSNEGFIMDRVLIIEAWCKYRPSSKENSPNGQP